MRTAVLAFVSALCLGPDTVATAGVIYASNFGANTITKYDSSTGAMLGTVTIGPELMGPNGVRQHSDGNVYVTGQFSNNVAKYDAATGFLNGVLDPSNAAGLNSPQGLAFGADGKLYVASAGDDRIVMYDPANGTFLGTFATVGGAGHNGLIAPRFSAGFLYVSAFDSGSILKLDATTGALLDTFAGPAGFGFGDLAIGPDGNLYVAAINLADFTGSVLRYDVVTGVLLGTFVSTGSGGLVSPGGLAFADGFLYVTNVLIDQNFNDQGSTILRFDAGTGGFVNQLVEAGNGLSIPFFLDAPAAAPIPEPETFLLLGPIIGALAVFRLLRAHLNRSLETDIARLHGCRQR